MLPARAVIFLGLGGTLSKLIYFFLSILRPALVFESTEKTWKTLCGVIVSTDEATLKRMWACI